MSFLRSLLGLVGCSRLPPDMEDGVVNNIEENDLFLYPEESFCDQFSDLRYIPGAWTSPSLGRKMVDKVRDSPRLARKAMSKMTSPMVSKRKKEDDIYIVTLHVVHSSEMVRRGEAQGEPTQVGAWGKGGELLHYGSIQYCICSVMR